MLLVLMKECRVLLKKGILKFGVVHNQYVVSRSENEVSKLESLWQSTVKPLITDPPKSGQPLYSNTDHLPPIDFTIELIHFEPPRSGHLSTPNNGH